MVIPIPAGGNGLQGPVPEELQPTFQRIKACVLVMIAANILKFLSGMCLLPVLSLLAQSLSSLMCTTCGIFLLKDEKPVDKVYKFIATTICQVCADNCSPGMPCLRPFVFCCFITVMLDLFGGGILDFAIAQLKVVFAPDKWPNDAFGICFSTFILSIIIGSLAQFIGAYFGWQAMKQLDDGMGTGYGPLAGDTFGGGGVGGPPRPGPFLGGGGGMPASSARPNNIRTGGGGGYAPPAQQQEGWKPFSGSGHRLGS